MNGIYMIWKNISQMDEKFTHANPVLIFCQNKNNKKTDMRKIVSYFRENCFPVLIRSAKVDIIYETPNLLTEKLKFLYCMT